MSDIIKNAVFVASAGTGKTYQVTGLYRNLVLGRRFPEKGSGTNSDTPVYDGSKEIDCREILMLTFAKNAAAEMRTRITENIEAEMAERPDDQQLWSILRSLSSANISTIHSYAQRLLKENAVLASISPSAGITEDDEATELFEKAIERTLLSRLGRMEPDSIDNLEELYRARSGKYFIKSVYNFAERMRSWNVQLNTVEPEELLSQVPVPTTRDLADLYEELDPIISVQKTCKGGKALCSDLAEILDSFSVMDSVSPENIAAAARDLLNRRYTARSWSRTNEQVNELRKKAKAKLEIIAGYNRHVKARECLIDFIEFTAHCLSAYEHDKTERGLLDYGDLLSMALELVETHPETVPAFKVIIVDEAQDNSLVQNRLIEAIRQASGASVILCGDSKQTIHTWRGAEYGGMDKFASSLKNLIRIPLSTSFRSQKGVLDWINGICASDQVFGDAYDDEARLLPNEKSLLTHGINVELLLPDWEYAGDLTDTVEVPDKKNKPETRYRFELTGKDLTALAELDPDKPDEWEQAVAGYPTRQSQEARAVARRIKLMCSADSSAGWRPVFVYNEETGTWSDSGTTRYRYRDVLILLRATTSQHMFEAALREEGIPYTTGGKGKGFFYRQEVRDIVSLLAWLAFERDDASLLAVARSPFVSLSDPAIAVLSRQSGTGAGRFSGEPLRFAMTARSDTAKEFEQRLYEAGLDDDAQAYMQARSMFGRLRKIAGRVTAVDLVREAIKQSGFDAVQAGGFHGAQKLANMRKMLSLIQVMERRDNLDLQAMATRLNNEIGVTEAPDAVMMDPADDSVRISTVHAAKGLTSPVVIIPDLQRGSRNERGWILSVSRDDRNGQLVSGEVKLIDEETGEDKFAAHDFEAVRELLREQRDLELERLFYVALTRPRDLIILSGSSSRDAGSWRCWINEYIKGLINDDAAAVDRQVRVMPYSSLQTALPDTEPEQTTSRPDAEDFAAVRASLKLPVTPRSYRLPVTALLKVPADPSDRAAVLEYRRTAMAGLAPAWVRSNEDVDEETPEASFGDISAVDRGTSAHALLETYDFEKAPAVDPSMSAVVKAVVHMVDGADIIIREMPFCAMFREDNDECMVDGKIDLLYRKDNIWHIVDYKFSEYTQARLLEQYELQLLVYRSAISRELDSGLRDVRLKEAPGPAEVRMLIMGINRAGKISEVKVESGISDASLAARLISVSRTVYGM